MQIYSIEYKTVKVNIYGRVALWQVLFWVTYVYYLTGSSQ